MIEQNRNYKIDYMRAICSITVILAHVGAPSWLNQIRTFDVIALVMMSGMCLVGSSKIEYGAYLWKRVKKLLIPTVIMATAVFSLSFIVCQILQMPQLYSSSRIVRSYLLLHDGSMGYVWITRVYLSIAVLTPVIKRVESKMTNGKRFGILMVCCVAIMLVLQWLGGLITLELASVIYFDYIYSSFIYAVIALIGLWCAHRIKRIPAVAIFAMAIFAVCFGFIFFLYPEQGLSISSYKFPPQLYYCAYGVSITCILYQVLPKRGNATVVWLSKKSFSIYLWHIVVLKVYGLLIKLPFLAFLEGVWLLEFAVGVSGAILATFLFEYVRETVKKSKTTVS